MLCHDICLVSVLGLRGTLRIQETEDAEGVSVQTEGPYAATVVDGAWLVIHPEGQPPPLTARSHANIPITAGRTHVGAVDVVAKAQFLTDSVPRVRTRAAIKAKATVTVTAPPGTWFELIGCHGLRKGPRGRLHFMQRNCRFDIR